jgi:hypothetical protein
MKPSFALSSIVALAALNACDRPTGPANDLSARVDANVVSGCYSVRANWRGETITGPTTITGPLSGDLIGTFTSDFDFSTIRITGSTMSLSGTGYWNITGGVLPAPVNFVTAIDNRNQLSDRPGSDATVFENVGRHRALSGVSVANLTYRGGTPPGGNFLVSLDLHGVVCP